MSKLSKPNNIIFEYFNEFLKHALNEIPHEYNANLLFLGERQIPNPVKYKLDVEIFEYLLQYYNDLDPNNSKPSSEVLSKIVKLIEASDSKSYVHYLILICSYFMLGKYPEAVKPCLSVFKLYSNGDINYYEYKFVANVYGFICLKELDCEKANIHVLTVLSPRSKLVSDIKGFEDVIFNLQADFGSKYIFHKYITSDSNNWVDFIGKVKLNIFDVVIFMTHGGKKDGLVLNFKDELPVFVSAEHLRDIQALLKDKSNPIILLGCEGNKYKKEDYNFVNRIYTTYVWSKPENQYFLFGFLRAFAQCNDFISSFYAGRISLMIRAHSNYKIHFGIINNVISKDFI